jgi:hypothetical protein
MEPIKAIKLEPLDKLQAPPQKWLPIIFGCNNLNNNFAAQSIQVNNDFTLPIQIKKLVIENVIFFIEVFDTATGFYVPESGYVYDGSLIATNGTVFDTVSPVTVAGPATSSNQRMVLASNNNPMNLAVTLPMAAVASLQVRIYVYLAAAFANRQVSVGCTLYGKYLS